MLMMITNDHDHNSGLSDGYNIDCGNHDDDDDYIS